MKSLSIGFSYPVVAIAGLVLAVVTMFSLIKSSSVDGDLYGSMNRHLEQQEFDSKDMVIDFMIRSEMARTTE